MAHSESKNERGYALLDFRLDRGRGRWSGSAELTVCHVYEAKTETVFNLQWRTREFMPASKPSTYRERHRVLD